MAAEVPVEDVLCEAMEYLTKLGSNLRTRSENLKEKRIRKDKLTNVLAVQKAADKVLLICELSKKSLANVEAGVRKIKEHIDISQTTSRLGGKSPSSKTESKKRDDKPKYHYFDYKSRKLKIKNKISLRHYKSVKVLARKMSSSMLNKYPVYLDCKLYRMRRKKESNKSESLKQKEPESGKELEKTENDESGIVKSITMDRASSAELEDNSDIDISKTNENRRSFSENTRRRNSNSNKKKKYVISDDSDNEYKTKQNDGKNCARDPSSSDNENRQKQKDPKKGRDDDNSSDNEKHQKVTKKKDEKKIWDDDYDNSSDNAKKHNDGKIGMDDDNSSDNEKTTSKNDHEPNKSCNEPESKKRKLNKIEDKQLNENNSDVISIDSDIENSPSNSKVSNDSTDGVSNKNDAESNTDTNDNKENNFEGSTKPLIKCVSISKLLKPDVLQKDPIKKSVPKKGKKLVFDVDKKNEMLQAAKENKDKFWAQKRKEICAFKPKKFAININRLPELSTKFLLDNNLKKITKEGEIICEISKDKSVITVSDSSNKNVQVNDAQLKAKTDKIKSSSLNESESDNNEKESETTLDRIKNALLNYSDSDQSTPKTKETGYKEKEKVGSDNNERRMSEISDTLENSESDQRKADGDSKTAKNNLEKSDSDNKSAKSDKSCKEDGKEDKNYSESENDSVRDHKTPEKESTDNIDDFGNNAKNCLLKDSDHETEAPLDQRKAATHSKKKCVRESALAKKALLRLLSSGSETEDDQIRNVLNDIKKSLLDSKSDDETILKINNTKSSQESSSSEDILEKKKTKKKSTQCSCETDSNSSVPRKKLTKRKKRGIKSDSQEEKNSSSDDEDKPTSSRSKMVRSKAKPGNSSSHSSDAQDSNDKHIQGLVNLRTLNSSRRRISDTDKESTSNSAATRTRMSGKPTGLIDEEMLKAESSSDAASADEGEAIDEDLPPVMMSGFNGDLEHLVKEDLLGESDSSVSNKGDIKEDSDEEERLNAKRRKANAIASSDSETGTARNKNKDDDVRLSDFEDSDDSDTAKKSKRKKKGSDSDASTGSTDAGKKKRRRIKSVNDSDGSGSDSENEGKNKHGRKNIRKVMGKNQLEEATKKAAREEKERVARIAERQKMYNNLQFDESGKPDEVVLEKVILDFDPETKEPLIAVDRGLVKKLKPHQANGIKFMWDACFESAKRLKKDKGSGCILAHCMGLGKTLQVVALTHTLLAHDSLTKVRRVLVVCPLSTVLNWVNEFKMWLKHAERESDIDVYELSRFKQNGERAFQLSQWFEHGGVCVLGYEMFRNLSADNNKKFKKKMLKNFQEALVDPGPDLVVCDEGHLLKNEKTSLSQSMNKVRTLRRIVLTGTPLQNNLKEYYCMVQFVKPNLLGKYNEYLNRFVNPITNGQYTDSTEHDIKIMKRRSHVLHKMLDGAVQRRDYGVLAPFLPPKHEYVLFITLTEVQTKLYQFYLDNYSRRPLPGKSSGFLFPDFQSLQRIWTHPLVLKYNSERYEILQQKKRDKEEEDSEGSLVDFIDDDSTPAESSSEDLTDDSSDMSDDSRKKSKKKKSSKKGKGKDKDKDKDKESTAGGSRRRATRANPVDLDLEDDKVDDIIEVRNENPTEWWIKLVEEDVLDDLRNSHKLVLLFDILRQCETIGDKLLVFSQSLYSLDLIEHFLGKVDEATQEGRIDEKLGGHVGSWSPGVDYFRLDGSTSCENRSIWCKNFNREDNPRARLFLISTRAGGLGINLVAANRVVIFDVSWNPSHDVQSIFRVYRFGQKKPCYVYRFLAMGTMEEKIYERQVTKQAISKRVIDEQQIDRHYAENDLAELYKFEAEPPSPRPIPPLPKDRLFAEMLREHDAQIYKYHEHDSLLENKEEETLSEEERKAAWEDFENEKNRPPPAPFPAPWPMTNGMMPNMLAQQQQQLAYAALVSMLRKEMPNVNDNQIRDMLPMIYNANPALMQKMSDIYKYSQQMSMAPGMMGQGGMNPASSGGAMAGMGGASGLQYEPPWQRQQQQQQQMRLQQMMAQQQNMGAAAKFYAGGLGSRDPVAMALQQQRAREIMVGGGTGAGRPRGRPPLQPRDPPTPAAAADVVNLDSD